MPDNVIGPISNEGAVCIFCIYSKNETDLVVDVSGWSVDGPAEHFAPAAPMTMVDAR